MIEAIPMLYYLGKVYVKRLYCFKSQKFWTLKRYRYFYAKKLNRQSDCIISNPRIFKGETIQVLLHQKSSIVKAIVLFLMPEFLKMKRYKYFYAKIFESTKQLYHFKPQKLLRWSDTITFVITSIWSDCMSAIFLWGGGFIYFILP